MSSTSTPTPKSGSSLSRLAWLVLIGAALAAYGGTFAVPFLFDDSLSIVDNPTLRHLWPIWKTLMPPPHAGVGGRPLLNLTFALNYAWSGLKPGSYHAVNLAIHILAAITLFEIVRRTVRAALPALAVALLWELHPVQTEAVTYIVGRAESLMGLFYLLTLYCFIRYATDESPAAFAAGGSRSGTRKRFAPEVAVDLRATVSRRRWAALSILSCLCGLATKETMVTAPVVILLYDRCFLAKSFRTAWRERRAYYLALASTWILLLALLPGVSSRGAGGAPGFIWWHGVLTNGSILTRYLRLAFWPHPLVLDYGTASLQWPAAFVPCLIAALVVLAATIWSLGSRPALGFLGAWFLIILAPTTSLIPLLEQPMAEHRLYLALAAPIAAVVFGIRSALRRFAPAWRISAGALLAAAAALLLGGSTAARNTDYASALAIWQDTVAKAPDNPRAHQSLGSALLDAGRPAAAALEFREDLRLRPSAPAHYDLGVALAERGQFGDAEPELEEAVRLKPDYPEALNALGLACVQMHLWPKALDSFERAARLRPDNAQLQVNIGNIYYLAGRWQPAIDHYQAALRLNPNYTAARQNLALAQKSLQAKR